MKEYNDPCFADDKIYSFVDGRTTAEENKLFMARMAVDKEFANMIEDLVDAVNAITVPDEIDTSFDYSRTALAAFCDNDAKVLETTDGNIAHVASITQRAGGLADDFLDSLGENKSKKEME